MSNEITSNIIEKRTELKNLIQELQNKNPEFYLEILYINNKELQLVKGNETIESTTNKDEGIKVRIFDESTFHEIALSGYNLKKLKKETIGLMNKLIRIKKSSSIYKTNKTNEKIKLTIDKECHDLHFKAHGKINPKTITIKEKLNLINDLHKKLGQPKKLLSTKVRYTEVNEQKIFVNKYKLLSQDISLCQVSIISFVKSIFGDVRYSYNSYCDHGYEVTRITDSEIKKIISFAEKIKKAKKIKPGKYLCLLTPNMSGLLAHESFGHGMEADTLFKGRAKAINFLGKRLAKKEVSIADGPLIKGKHGFYFFDDEGTLATKTYMLKEGIVNNPIGDNYNTSRLKIPRTSNARCESFDHKIYSRMTNTYFEPGKAKKKDMLSSIKEGLYLHNSGGGMEDPKGWGIQIQGIVAEKIKNGKLTGELFYEAGLTGYLPTVLKNIKSVSKEFKIPGVGFCGKGHKEWVRVSEGGPYLLIKNLHLS